MNCAVRRCWKAASPPRRSPPCARRSSSPITHRSSRCYWGRRSWRPRIRRIPRRRSGFCGRRWHARTRRRWASCSSPWPMAEKEITRRPRGPRPASPSVPPVGSGPTTSSPPSRRRATRAPSTGGRRFRNRISRKEDLPMPSFRLLVSALFALAVCALPGAASAQSFSDSQRGDIEVIVKNYLIAHPEVLEEAMNELNKRQAAAEAEKHEASVASNADAIFNSPRGVVLGNKDGDVTFVEFFDYNCGYCKRAMSDMLKLMKTDPKLKVVLKEFPVLGEGSVEAAKVAVAVRMQDPGGKKYLDFHQKLRGGRGPADKARAMAAAKEAGLDTARIEKDLGSPEVRATIEENFKLAEAMGMNGTPSYVIGKQVVVGAVGLDDLMEKIGMARCGKATC